jgi:hypothetical protein
MCVPEAGSRLPRVNPVVEAAWIATITGVVGVAGSVTVAIVSSRNTRKATEATVEGERIQRFRERQATAYEDAIGEVLLRSTRREKIFSQGDIGGAMPQLREIRSRNEEPESLRVHGLLMAYASPGVRRAYEAAVDADEQVGRRLVELVQANTAHMAASGRRETGESTEPLQPVPDYKAIHADLMSERDLAVAKADAFVEAVREALPPKGSEGSKAVVKKEER